MSVEKSGVATDLLLSVDEIWKHCPKQLMTIMYVAMGKRSDLSFRHNLDKHGDEQRPDYTYIGKGSCLVQQQPHACRNDPRGHERDRQVG